MMTWKECALTQERDESRRGARISTLGGDQWCCWSEGHQREETGSLRTESNKQARTEIEKVYSCP